MSIFRNNTEALAQYLQSMVKLEELQKMTEDLDKELEDSQRLMSEIKSIFNTVPNVENGPPPLNVELRREQLAQFLAADGPRVLIPGMVEEGDVDIETTLVALKSQVEDLKKNIVPPDNQHEQSDRPTENLNLEQYVASLDEFSKRLADIKLNRANGNNRNAVLEMKLSQLFEDVNNLTQVVKTKTQLAEANANSAANQLDNATALIYDNLINKLLYTINEVTYLLSNGS